jgi:hypothetical protein
MTATTPIRSAPDYDEIVRVVHLYSDAFGAGNINMFLHNLIRLDGVWEITNKTATHISRAAEA